MKAANGRIKNYFKSPAFMSKPRPTDSTTPLQYIHITGSIYKMIRLNSKDGLFMINSDR
jgi:hypothetical protein